MTILISKNRSVTFRNKQILRPIIRYVAKATKGR